MDDLIAFVRARLDEDEAAAKAATRVPWQVRNLGRPELSAVIGKISETETCRLPLGPLVAQTDGADAAANSLHIARHDPARVLREVKTWRRLLLEYSIPPEVGSEGVEPGVPRGFRLALSFALKCKAMEWSDHPDYREDWLSAKSPSSSGTP